MLLGAIVIRVIAADECRNAAVTQVLALGVVERIVWTSLVFIRIGFAGV